MNTFKKWLVENNFTFETVNLVNGDLAYLIDLTYEGPYPSDATFKNHAIIRTKAKKLRLKYQQAGFYNGAFITLNK